VGAAAAVAAIAALVVAGQDGSSEREHAADQAVAAPPSTSVAPAPSTADTRPVAPTTLASEPPPTTAAPTNPSTAPGDVTAVPTDCSRTIPDGSSVATSTQTLAAGMVGTWKGCITTPWPPRYLVTLTLRADGGSDGTTVQNRLTDIRLTRNTLPFEFLHLGRYGPLRLELYRQP
jgi:hypothetical protein